MRWRLPLGLAAALLTGCTVVAAPPPEPAPQPPAIRPEPEPEAVPEPAERPVRPPEGPVRRFDEVRGLWVVRYTMTSETAVERLVEDAAAAGVNTLVVQVRGRADAFYRSSLEPLGEPVSAAAGYDPLAHVIELAHARGMAVHAWVNTHLVWGPATLPESPRHLVHANPDWLAVPRPLARDLARLDPADPRYVRALVQYATDRPATVEGVFTSPSHPEVQDRVHAVWMDLARRYDLDGIHFDYVRFPSRDFDYSIQALEPFRLWVLPRLPRARFDALDGASRADLFAFTHALPELWDEYRRGQVTALVARIYRDVKAERPRLVVSAAVIADAQVAFEERFQDWTGWLREGILDVAVPMAYTPDADRFQTLVRTARFAAAERERLWAGIGVYLNTPAGTLDQIDAARRLDAGGIMLFSYDWAVGEGRGDPRDPLLQRIGRERFRR